MRDLVGIHHDQEFPIRAAPDIFVHIIERLRPVKPLALQRPANERLERLAIAPRQNSFEVALGILEAAVKRRIDDWAFNCKTGTQDHIGPAREGPVMREVADRNVEIAAVGGLLRQAIDSVNGHTLPHELVSHADIRCEVVIAVELAVIEVEELIVQQRRRRRIDIERNWII